MKASFFQEPELEFGNGGTHVDIRYGLMRYGPLDLGETSAPIQLRIGLVGTEETIAMVRHLSRRYSRQTEQALEPVSPVPRFLWELAVSRLLGVSRPVVLRNSATGGRSGFGTHPGRSDCARGRGNLSGARRDTDRTRRPDGPGLRATEGPPGGCR